jgi:ABC-2 type transport system ATP-binding protein
VTATEILALRGVHRSFGAIEAVAGIDLRVAAGETLALLGPNGAGKSTTLGMILGLLSPSSGQVTVLGRAPHQAISEGLVGALLQSGTGSGLPPGSRVGELVRFMASLYPAPLAPATVLERAGLTELAGRRVDGLSGGELQRVRFALAICADPELLILDEPTVGLDVVAQRGFWQTVGAFAAEGRAVIFATHYLAEAEETARRVVVLNRGRVVADGPVSEIRRIVATKQVRFTAPEADPDTLRALPAVQNLRAENGAFVLDSLNADDTVRGLYQAGVAFRDLEVASAGLEAAFMALTSQEPVR